jgi:hypothetical protein
MNTVLFGIAALVGLMVLIQGFVSADPAGLAVLVRRAAAATLLAFATVLLVTGRVLVAIPIFLFGLSLAGASAGRYARWLRPFLGQWRDVFGSFGNRRPSVGGASRSTVRSAALEMTVDQASGTLSGRVLAGRFEGRELARLSIEDLLVLRLEISSDPESRALLEAYLDRRAPLWRDHVQEDPTARSRGAARPGAMTDEEAHQILGLRPGAGEAEIREAHRRLIKAVHPDVGGSTFLAAKINEAKDRLIGRHGTRSNH